MPITTRKPSPPTKLQQFRTITESYLLQVAQKDFLRQYPSGSATTPAPRHGWVYKLLPIIFLPGYKLTPWPVKRRLLKLFFVHREQQWPDKPWET
ncbi:MAG: hypothetical protein L0154_03685 [Chloroflexi bacterium]|nr:hypothetical protein [Chloroflexota bacterium]